MRGTGRSQSATNDVANHRSKIIAIGGLNCDGHHACEDEAAKGQPVVLPKVDIEAAAKAIGAIRYPNATEVTPQSRNFATACAEAWGLKWK